MVVLGLIAVILAVSLPQLMPAILFSRLEGSARHLSGYGRSAMAHAALMQERITVRIDFEKQEYWTLRWKDPEDGGLFEGGLFDDSRTEEDRAQDRTLDLLAGGEGGVDAKAEELQRRFDRFAMMGLRSRSKHVRQEGVLSDIGPLFEKEFTLDTSDEEESLEEVRTTLLERTQMPEGVVIASVRLGSQEWVKGVVDIEITPTGLTDVAVFQVKDESDNYYTVEWDPITGGARIYEGRYESEAAESEGFGPA